jgi:transposase
MRKNSRKPAILEIADPIDRSVFAGIDYHKTFIMVSIGDKDGEVLLRKRIYTIKEELLKFFRQFKQLVCVVESCRGYEWFVDFLKDELGFEVYVCSPAAIKAFLNRTRTKCDRIDSDSLMELLAKDFLPLCYVPTADERELREMLRWRCQLLRSETRAKLRIHALLDKENKGTQNTDLFTIKGREYLRSVELLNETRRKILDEQLDLLERFEEIRQEYDRQISRLAKTEEAMRLKTTPGIADLSALLLIAELGDINRFRRAKQVVKYVGLCPSVYESGSTRHTGKITKQGPSILRWILIQNAWAAVNSSAEMRERFNALLKRCGKKKAIVAIARRLLEIVFHILKNKVTYDARLQVRMGG